MTPQKKIINYLQEEERKSEEAREYFCQGYLRDPPKEGQSEAQRIINNGSYQLRETFAWNKDENLWQVQNREWSITKTIPDSDPQNGIFAGLVLRCRDWQRQDLQNGLAQRQKFFDPPKTGEPTEKSRSWSENICYEYCWNPERDIWDEVGRYRIAQSQGELH